MKTLNASSSHWKSFTAILFLLCFSACILSACGGGGSDSPTTPETNDGPKTSANNGSCAMANSCPGGGWVKSCVRDDLSAYYLTSDQKIFECTGSGVNVDCSAPAWDAAAHCQDKL